MALILKKSQKFFYATNNFYINEVIWKWSFLILFVANVY